MQNIHVGDSKTSNTLEMYHVNPAELELQRNSISSHNFMTSDILTKIIH
jgi:hypothetical protein